MILAVLMTVHNRKDKTMECLRKLFQNKIENIVLEVFVTDDGCTDGTQQAILKEFSNVHIIQGDGALYWNRGMLAAWKEAAKMNPDLYLWLNDDTMLCKDAIGRLLESAKRHNYEAVVVGSTCDDWGKISYGGQKDKWRNALIQPSDKIEIECAKFNGNIVLIPRKVFEKAGFNDGYFHHSFGDIEYGLRTRTLGIKNYIAPGIYGKCNRNNPIPIFRRKKYSLVKRYRLLYSPLGYSPLEDFYLTKKYYPYYIALLRFVKIHINVLFAVGDEKTNC